MKIYFAGSIRSGRADVELYSEMINHLKNFGEVFTEHVGRKDLALNGEDSLSDRSIHKRDLDWLTLSDAVVAEVSTPSLGVGYEIGRGLEMKKHILCVFRPQEGKMLSAMIAGCPDVTVKSYSSLEEVKSIIDDFFKSLKTE
jgi:hypothetical protein